MRILNRFEHDLLRIAYCLVGQASRAEALPLMRGGIPRPACLDRDTIELLQAALAKGVVRLLARQGWQRERFLRGEQPVEGRLWQRWRPEELGMAFSVASLELLIWLTTRHAPDLPSRRAARKRPETTLGDRFIAFLAFRAVENTPVAEEMRRLPAVVDNSLCRLAFPQEFADGSHPSSDWSPWITGPGVPVFEALQQELGQRWVRIEENKMQSTRVENILNVGLAQRRVLEGLLDALERAGRRDLARFLLMAGSRLLRGGLPADALLARIDRKGMTMGQRAAVSAAAFAFLRIYERLEQWEQQARSVGYFDEGYAASQLWKADWERFGGAAACDAVRAIIRQSDPLRPPTGDAIDREPEMNL